MCPFLSSPLWEQLCPGAVEHMDPTDHSLCFRQASIFPGVETGLTQEVQHLQGFLEPQTCDSSAPGGRQRMEMVQFTGMQTGRNASEICECAII